MEPSINMDVVLKKVFRQMNIELFWMFLKPGLICLFFLLHLLFSPAYLGWTRAEASRFRQIQGEYVKQYKWLTPKLFRTIYEESIEYKVNPGIICAIIEAESGGYRYAVSSSNARGYMQIMPFNYNGKVSNLFNPRTNIRTGIRLFKRYLSFAKGNIVIALKNYNSGPASNYYNLPYISKVLSKYYGHMKYQPYPRL